MSENITTDPKFVPSAASLEVVGIKVSQIKTDAALVEFVKGLAETRQLTDAQEAVAVYTARKRGHEYAWCLTELGIEEHTAKRREVEGMAILRLGEITRTVSAIRTGELGVKVVDEITSKAVPVEDRIDLLNEAAFGRYLQRTFKVEGKDEIPTEVLAAALTQAKATVEAKVEPMNAGTLKGAVPSFSEDLGLVKKEQKRTPQVNESGPMGLEFNLKKALSDIRKIEEATNGAPYVPTTQDYAALFALCDYLAVMIEMPQDVMDAILALEAADL